MQKFIENLEEAERINSSLNHLVYVTFPVVKDKKMLLKVIVEVKTSITKTINSILHYEFIYKKIRLSENQQKNFQTFVENCAPRYKITSIEISKIKELFDLIEKHHESSMEFTRGEKVVILSPEMKQRAISLEQTKEYLELAKTLTQKAKDHMLVIKEK